MDFAVDMIRLVTKVAQDEFGEFRQRYFSQNPAVNCFLKSRMQDYHYNFSIDDTAIMATLDLRTGVKHMPSNRFYCAYVHNQESISGFEGKKYSLVIEFNPNKCDLHYGLLNLILKTFFRNVHTIKIVSADFCCDVSGVSIDNVTVDKGRRRTFIDYQSNGGRGLYVGKRGSNGQVKIYDKAAELGLKNKVLTRYECHLVFGELYANMVMGRGFSIADCLPTVYFDTGQVALIEDVKLRCCVMAVKAGHVDIREFNPRFRTQIKPYLEDTAKLVIGNQALKDIRETIITWFFWYCKELELKY